MANRAKKVVAKKAAKKKTSPAPKRIKPVGRQQAAPSKESLDMLDEGVIALKMLRNDQTLIGQQVKGAQDEVLGMLDALGLRDHTVTTPDGVVIKATRVQSMPIVLDEEALKKRLGSAMWNKITTRVLDKKKLDAFISSGEIDPSAVAMCSTTVPGTPFVRTT